MKSAILFTTLSLLLLLNACQPSAEKNRNGNDTAIINGATSRTKCIPRQLYAGRGLNDSSRYINIDSANKMIKSYMASISASANDSDLQSITFSADSLKKLLNSSSGGGIKYVKLTFAHTLKYINAGGYGVNAGYQSGALTLIISGYNTAGNYVYAPYNDMVLDNGTPCPTSCDNVGTASSDTFCMNVKGHP